MVNTGFLIPVSFLMTESTSLSSAILNDLFYPSLEWEVIIPSSLAINTRQLLWELNSQFNCFIPVIACSIHVTR